MLITKSCSSTTQEPHPQENMAASVTPSETSLSGPASAGHFTALESDVTERSPTFTGYCTYRRRLDESDGTTADDNQNVCVPVRPSVL